MPPRDPAKVQLDFPLLVADLIDQLRLVGAVGLLDFNPEVTPVFLIGSRGITFGSQLPDFASSEVFSGTVFNPLANTVIADTGPLAAGTYDIFGSLTQSGNVAFTVSQFRIEHRNAANTATLATPLICAIHNSGVISQTTALPPIGYQIGLNERLRAIGPDIQPSGTLGAVIGVALRPTP